MGNFRKKAKAYVKRQAKRVWSGAKKRYGGSGGMANILKDISMLKTALNVEKKYHQFIQSVGSGQLVYAQPLVWCPFDGLAQGTTEFTRTGDQVKALWSSIRLHFEINGNTGTDAQRSTMFRIIAFYDVEPRGDTASSAVTYRNALLQNFASGPLTMNSFYNVEGLVGDRYKIVRDFKFTLDVTKQRQKFVNLTFNHTKEVPSKKGRVIKYDAENDAMNQRLCIMVLSDDTSVAGSGFTDLTINQRVTFVDN